MVIVPLTLKLPDADTLAPLATVRLRKLNVPPFVIDEPLVSSK